MFIHSKIEHSRVNGPGDRAVIWLQGCTLKCPNCWNPETHTPGLGADVEFLDAWVHRIEDIEGVTFSGGEPMQQAPDLHQLIKRIRRLRPELTIGMFSGYSQSELDIGQWSWYEKLIDGRPYYVKGTSSLWKKIKEELDFAVLGRYNQRLRTLGLPMRSSCNQELLICSSFYKEQDFEPPTCEITISATGDLIHITGFPENHKALEEAF